MGILRDFLSFFLFVLPFCHVALYIMSTQYMIISPEEAMYMVFYPFIFVFPRTIIYNLVRFFGMLLS